MRTWRMRIAVGMPSACLLAAALAACGGTQPREASAITAGDESSPSEDAPSTPSLSPGATPIEGSDGAEGTLRVVDGALRFEPTEGGSEPVPCRAALTGDITPHDGEETFWQCGEPSAAMALSAGDAVVWGRAFVPTECWPEDTVYALVDAIAGGPQEIHLRVLECDSTGAMSDSDQIFAWDGSALREVAGARLYCDDMSDTSDADAEVPRIRRWLCGGTFVELAGNDEAPTVTEVTVRRGVYAQAQRDENRALVFGPDREDFDGQSEDGLVPVGPDDFTRRRLRFDPAEGRFVPAASEAPD